jgi:hypothetical protein
MGIEFGPIVPQALLTSINVALGGLIGYLSSSRIARLNARLSAGAKLRYAFAPELASMRLARTDESGVVDRLLGDAFPGHAAAIEEYRFFVRRQDQAAYQQAWEEYYTNGGTTGGSVRWTGYYMGDKPKELFEHRVQAILRFTQR